MDGSYSNVNEAYYDAPLNEEIQMMQPNNNQDNDLSNPYNPDFNYNGPLSPNYYQEQHPSNKHTPYTYMEPQTFYENSAYQNYQITNDHRGQYVLKRQDVNTNLISTNER